MAAELLTLQPCVPAMHALAMVDSNCASLLHQQCINDGRCTCGALLHPPPLHRPASATPAAALSLQARIAHWRGKEARPGGVKNALALPRVEREPWRGPTAHSSALQQHGASSRLAVAEPVVPELGISYFLPPIWLRCAGRCRLLVGGALWPVGLRQCEVRRRPGSAGRAPCRGAKPKRFSLSHVS